MRIKKGATSQSVYLKIPDLMSDVGAGLTGLVFNTSGLSAYYARERGAATSITLATLAAATTAYSSGGFKEVDATNMPGVYRLDLPDAACAWALGINGLIIQIKGAANMPPIEKEIELFDDLASYTFTAASGASGQVTLPGGASATDDFFNGYIVVIVSGTGAGQARVVSDYTGSSKQADVSPNWGTAPDNTSVVILVSQ